ncbi:LOW QUALITY PROTEIN: uncharacterized protein EMH_0045770 [Eimeria mitis]|uniref:Uncharacterized protein n=1 Tax=Eimeria mitis TaxID=44415 RepID=U6KDD7_9EIME|nr:LOW QUALITY PROTEIN: uncharacterized protein EMH_0045770 [Eimeria mitis]CDJ35944.1 hypothetical protein, conserved [Eimeria mitis]
MPAPAAKLPSRPAGGSNNVSPSSDGDKKKGFCSFVRRFINNAIDHVENTPAVLAAKNQKLPCGVGRYFVLVTLIVAILGASKSASFAVPTILDKIEMANPGIGLREVCLGYALVGPGLCFIVSLFLIPYKHFKPWNDFQGAAAGHGKKIRDEEDGVDEDKKTQDEKQNKAGQSIADDTEEVPAIYQATRMSVATGGAGNAETLDQLAAVKEEKPASFIKQFTSPYAICIVVYSILKAIMYAFFTTAAENLLGKEVNDFMGAALPFSLFPCIVSAERINFLTWELPCLFPSSLAL